MKACPRCSNTHRGDKGQRFMILGTFKGQDDFPMAWCDTFEDAEDLIIAFKKWPAVKNPRIIDRHK